MNNDLVNHYLALTVIINLLQFITIKSILHLSYPEINAEQRIEQCHENRILFYCFETYALFTKNFENICS